MEEWEKGLFKAKAVNELDADDGRATEGGGRTHKKRARDESARLTLDTLMTMGLGFR